MRLDFGKLVGVIVMVLVGLVAACSKRDDADPVAPAAPTPLTPVHDTLNPPGGISNTDFYEAMRSGGADRMFTDDFVSPTTIVIRTVMWQGGYQPSASVATSFYVSIGVDNGSGFPRAEPNPGNTGRPIGVYNATYPVSQVQETVDAVVPCPNSNRQCGLYNYTLMLTTPFTASAGVRYWLTIQADVPFPSPGSWGWRRGTPHNQRSLSNIAGATHPFDFAFALR